MSKMEAYRLPAWLHLNKILMRFKIFSSFKIFSLPGLVIAAAEVVLLAAESDILAGVGSWATGRLELLSLLLGLAGVLLLRYLPDKHIHIYYTDYTPPVFSVLKVRCHF